MSALVAVLVLFFLPQVSTTGSPPYEIGVDDLLRLTVLDQPTFSGDFTVDRNGLLVHPVLGKVKASGLTPVQLERKLELLLEDGYLKQPQVTVAVREYRSQRVLVTGEVPRPGTYPLRADRTLLGLLADVGGLTAGAGHEIVVMRSQRPDDSQAPADPGALPQGVVPLAAPGSEVFKISVRELQSGNQDRNLILQTGDTVFVPKAAVVYVTGQVNKVGTIRYQEGLTVLQALTLAGGPTPRGSEGKTRIIRMVEGVRKEFRVKPGDPVEPDDTIVVPGKSF
jgi:polysaccharide export outer membrane protein